MGNLIKVIILGIVEGITEWLPVSSTGHLILVENILHLNVAQNFKTMFEVVIQLGAILAVCVLYFRKLNPFSRSKTKVQKAATWILWVKVLIATIPAAVLGFLFDDAIDKVMGKPLIISVVLVVFGILFIVVENRTAGTPPRVRKLSEIDYKLALFIGLFQVIAMLLPGTSRSGITIRPASGHGQTCDRGVYFLYGDPGHVRREPFETGQIRAGLHGGRARASDRRFCGGFYHFTVCDPVLYLVCQTA